MTIARELQSAIVKAYGTTVDEYGQLEQGTPVERATEIAVRRYSQQNVSDPRYVDIEMIGLTKDTSIVPGEVISLALGDFRVRYVVPSDFWQEILLAKI